MENFQDICETKKHLVDGKYSFEELVNIEQLQKMFDCFSKSTGYTVGLVSYPEQKLLIASGWRDICLKFHRSNLESEIFCKQSNWELTSRLKTSKSLEIYACKNGLIDGAVPILIKDVHVANLFTGQMFFEKPDLQIFEDQAKKYGYPIKEYLKALREVPIVTEEAFRNTLVFLREMAIMLAEQGVAWLQLQEANMRIQEEQEKYRTLFDTVGDSIFLHDFSGNILDVNAEVSKVYGYPKEELLKIKAYQIDVPEEAKYIPERIRELKQHGKIHFETVHRIFDGSRIFVDVNSRIMFLHGKANVLSIARDISERKKAEEKIKNSRRYIENIVNSMSCLLVGVDLKNDITLWNDEAEKRIGISSHEVFGRNIYEIIPYLKKEEKKIRDAICFQEMQSDPRCIRYENGKYFYEDISIYPLIANGVEGAVIRIEDITERVNLEEIMVQSEKMMSLGGLAAGMAHEINNPLTGMLASAEIIKHRLMDLKMTANLNVAEKLDISMEKILQFIKARKIDEILQRIFESGSRAAGIIQNMLSFARKNSNVKTHTNLAKLLDHCIDFSRIDYNLKKKYDFKKIKIVRNYQENLPSISCEAGKIQQVFMNILKNGAEAMSEVTGRSSQFILNVFEEKASNILCVEIEDNGPGMNEETRKRIFDPFFTRKSQGTGLGLSVSYFIITKNHSGEMFVSSEVGKGSKFVIKLPISLKSQ